MPIIILGWVGIMPDKLYNLKNRSRIYDTTVVVSCLVHDHDYNIIVLESLVLESGNVLL